MIALAPSRRVRRTPWTDRVEAAGVTAYSVYNRMRLPATFRGAQEDCRHLKSAVQVWDVACERQVEITGPDATRLVQYLTPRDLSVLPEHKCAYIPVCGPDGGMLNDPVALRVDTDRWWISIADSDLLLWIMGVAQGGYDVTITEPDIHPLAVQGPLANDLASAVLGEGIRDLRFYGWHWFGFGASEIVVARSGYSKQGGVEIYCPGSEALDLWDALFEAGESMDVRAGGPNVIERIEGGLLSYGNDMDRDTTPFEAGLGRFCNGDHEHVGQAALESKRDPIRHIRPVEIFHEDLPPCDMLWPVEQEGRRIGHVTSAANSVMAGCGVAIAMIDTAASDRGAQVRLPDGSLADAHLKTDFWL